MRRVPLWVSPVMVCVALGCSAFSRDRETTMINRDPYPTHWWGSVPEEERSWWEILPQDAGPGEVILSKRNELGILSNFAATPFEFRGQRCASLEGFWQMMKYPEGLDDPRAQDPAIEWPHTRDEVAQMTGFEAKLAGDIAGENMRALGIDWVSFEGERFPYWDDRTGRHFQIIREAMRAKLDQNPEVREVLLSTGDLILRADHHQDPDWPPAWYYNEIWMEIRDELRRRD